MMDMTLIRLASDLFASASRAQMDQCGGREDEVDEAARRWLWSQRGMAFVVVDDPVSVAQGTLEAASAAVDGTVVLFAAPDYGWIMAAAGPQDAQRVIEHALMRAREKVLGASTKRTGPAG